MVEACAPLSALLVVIDRPIRFVIQYSLAVTWTLESGPISSIDLFERHQVIDPSNPAI